MEMTKQTTEDVLPVVSFQQVYRTKFNFEATEADVLRDLPTASGEADQITCFKQMENTKIEWCNHTFNPWIGCTKVSPGLLIPPLR
jgi:hypothetical protein